MKPEPTETNDRATATGGPPEEPLARMRWNIRRMLDQVCVEKRPCRQCGRQLWFLRTRRGAKAPYTDEAVNHFADCPKADAFRRPKAQTADSGAR